MPLQLRVNPAAFALSIVFTFACGGATVPPATPAPVPIPAATVPAPVRTGALPLPAVPDVDGPLIIRVQYPSTNQVITSRDSNFLLGAVGSGKATLTINGTPVRVYPNGAFLAFLPNPSGPTPQYDIVAVRGADIARTSLAIRYPSSSSGAAAPSSLAPSKKIDRPTARADTIASLNERIDSLRTVIQRTMPLGAVRLGQAAANDTDTVIIGRPINGGTYKWFFAPGTIVPMMDRSAGAVRVRLDGDLDVWVDSADATPVTQAIPRRVISNMRVRATSLGADVVMPIGAKAPYFVEEGDRSIVITLYGVKGNTDIVNYASADTMVRSVEWSQIGGERVRVTVNLRNQPFGYLVLWENNALVLKLRGRPAIDANRPLAGLTIVVDPGHPPIGSTGPTGLYEGNAVLPVGIRLKRILEERGARVVMTRTTEGPVALGDRPIIARRENPHAFVSIHLNAYPDGVNPYANPGTGTYFFRSHSEPLARDVQRGMVAQLGLKDLGVNYDNLAVVRPTWYPAVLCEGAFIIIPEVEAALRTPEYQERYALGIANGLEAYFRGLPNR